MEPAHLPPHLSTPGPLTAYVPPEAYTTEYQRFNNTRVHRVVHLCEVTLLISNRLPIKRCTYGRMAIRQIAAHSHASRAFVRGLPVRQAPISAPGAHKSTSYAPTGRVNVRQFGEMRILSEGEARPGVFEGAEPLQWAPSGAARSAGGRTGGSRRSSRFERSENERSPELHRSPGISKNGGYLLSQLVGQYHRRW